MNYVLLFGVPGGAEIIVIILVIIMFFGADKIPEFARMLGKGMREVKNATNDIQKEIKASASPITDITDKVDIKKQVKDLMAESIDHAPSNKDVIKEDEDNKDESKEEIKEDIILNDSEQVDQESISVTKTVSRKSPYDNKKEGSKPKTESD